MSSHATPSNDPLWAEFFTLMKWRHIVPGHDLVDTINRLLVKHPVVLDSGRQLRIPHENLAIGVETWELPRLWALIHPKQITDDEPTSTTGAVAVLRWADSEYLIDGRRRINHWHRNAHAGPHRVLVVLEASR